MSILPLTNPYDNKIKRERRGPYKFIGIHKRNVLFDELLNFLRAKFLEREQIEDFLLREA